MNDVSQNAAAILPVSTALGAARPRNAALALGLRPTGRPSLQPSLMMLGGLLLNCKFELARFVVQINVVVCQIVDPSGRHCLPDHVVHAQRVCMVALALERGLDKQPCLGPAHAGQICVGRQGDIILADERR